MKDIFPRFYQLVAFKVHVAYAASGVLASFSRFVMEFDPPSFNLIHTIGIYATLTTPSIKPAGVASGCPKCSERRTRPHFPGSPRTERVDVNREA